MKYYADLNESNCAVGVKEVKDNYINPGNSIEISVYDNDLIGRIHKSNGEFYPRLNIQTDKTCITSDGVDTATITSDYAETFSINNSEDYTVNPLEFASTVPGIYIITAKSGLYGKNTLVVEVV